MEYIRVRGLQHDTDKRGRNIYKIEGKRVSKAKFDKQYEINGRLLARKVNR